MSMPEMGALVPPYVCSSITHLLSCQPKEDLIFGTFTLERVLFFFCFARFVLVRPPLFIFPFIQPDLLNQFWLHKKSYNLDRNLSMMLPLMKWRKCSAFHYIPMVKQKHVYLYGFFSCHFSETINSIHLAIIFVPTFVNIFLLSSVIDFRGSF